jgi:hypothetical protein
MLMPVLRLSGCVAEKSLRNEHLLVGLTVCLAILGTSNWTYAQQGTSSGFAIR